jgi:hypothetical protein
MSFLPDLTPLINQIKEFNTNQLKTNSLLEEILQEIQSIKNTSIVEDQLKNK